MSEIANTILAQMGGINRLNVMIGACDFLAERTGVIFRFKGCRTANKCRVTLDPNDTYTVQFLRVKPRTLDVHVAAEYSGIYAEDLIGLFEKQTGLYLKF